MQDLLDSRSELDALFDGALTDEAIERGDGDEADTPLSARRSNDHRFEHPKSDKLSGKCRSDWEIA